MKWPPREVKRETDACAGGEGWRDEDETVMTDRGKSYRSEVSLSKLRRSNEALSSEEKYKKIQRKQ